MLIGSNRRYECNHKRISGSNIVVVGYNNLVLGYDNEVYGNDNTINGDRVKVWGSRNKITGHFAKIWTGSDNIIKGSNCIVFSDGGGNVVHAPPRKKEKKRKPAEEEEEVLYVEGPLPTDVAHDKHVVDGSDQKACIVCLERVSCCVALPCMHLSYCITCARRLCFGQNGNDLNERGNVHCAECRVAVDAIKRTF